MYKRQILYKAHQCLEMITIDKDTAHMKSKLAVDFADLVYNGKWFTPLREALRDVYKRQEEDRERFLKLHGTYEKKLYAVAVRVLGDRTAAEEPDRSHR